ncbi:DEAD/DEAH box helicase [Acetobacter sp.]|uniref:DEAD/DEAH box helicase n=1 Tax=Acetobacter sp. TaxID=440 RepID=UPI0039EBEC8C
MSHASSTNDTSSRDAFVSLGLSPALSAKAKNAGMKEPTPIQTIAIPRLLSGVDAEILAPTGTGKTGCYLLPLFAILQKRKKLTGLVIVPTRELARQVTDMAMLLAPSEAFAPFAVYGGAKDAEDQNDIPPPNTRLIVATPGRLLDLFRSERIEPADCRFLVLDEGDRLMTNEFGEEMHDILALLSKDRQTVLVSATASDDTIKAAQQFLHKPVRIEPARTEKPSIRQAIFFTTMQEKPAATEALLRKHPDRSAIVFASTRDEADQITRHLRKRGLKVTTLHGGLSQPARNASVEAFTSGKATILVATDIAARGLDIEQVDQVINLSPPEQPETFLHRIGRTGRAGRTGWAATLCAPEERKTMRKIESALKLKLAVLPVPPLPQGSAGRARGNR